MEMVLGKICDVACEVAGIERLEPDLEWQELGADSLHELEIIMRLEDEFEIAIPDEAAGLIKTPREAANYIAAVLRGEEPPVPPERLPWRQRIAASSSPLA